ncbi:MAG: gamma-glutamyl-gamma-aminobutyrate hydrolase family protein, partial [Planctomycetaceae bacterium]
LLLAGGPLDLDPVRLGMEPHPATRPMPSRREDFDRRLCKLAVEMRLPTLAIGLGMQELNVVCGGTLHQHIPESLPHALHHRDPVESTLRHVIEIVPGTRVDHIYGPGEIRVNSQHHMAVEHVAEHFRVSATAPDGVIESYESIDDDWYCLGVQWHPENETASALDMQVFESFLDACNGAPAPAILPMSRRAA